MKIMLENIFVALVVLSISVTIVGSLINLFHFKDSITTRRELIKYLSMHIVPIVNAAMLILGLCFLLSDLIEKIGDSKMFDRIQEWLDKPLKRE